MIPIWKNKPLHNPYSLKEDGHFFGSKGYVYLFFDTEGTHAVMLTKDSPCGISPSANPFQGIPQGKG